MLKVDIHLNFISYQILADFKMNKGETLGLYGKSGIGKSTLLKIIAGLSQAKRASIKWNDIAWNKGDLQLVKPQERNAGVVFQDFALFPNLTVEENLKYAQQIDDNQMSEIIEVLDIQSILHKKSNAISGGQKQRTALGRALAYNPSLLLMDEPFSAVDDAIKENIKHYIKTYISKHEKMAIIASHDKDDLAFFTDSILDLNDTKVDTNP